jgi:hypothetical protein
MHSWNTRPNPWFVASGGVLHAVWETTADKIAGPGGDTRGTIDVMYRRSLDGGATWQDPVQLTDGVNRSSPKLSASGDHIQIVVSDREDFFLLRSADGGATWDDPFVWPVAQGAPETTVTGSVGFHLAYRQQSKGKRYGVLSYAYVDLGFDPPPPIKWRHIGVA